VIAPQHERALDRRFYGVVSGIVVDNIDPDGLGRIKVSFPWYDDTTITEWCRVQQSYAGPGYGAFFIPEKQDEVLVAFVHGDMRMAVILGGLYSKADPPPTTRQADAVSNVKMIRTKGGNSVALDDTTGRTKLTITSAKGQTIELDDLQQTITIETPAGQSIVISGLDGSITLTAATTISIAAPAIAIGAATTGAVLGDALIAAFDAHTHALSGGPPGFTSTPTPLPPAVLSTTVKVG
jgi:uncharacterized protein involved in type VI secretion and phage assembly